MSTSNITLTVDEVDTVREALAALINKYPPNFVKISTAAERSCGMFEIKAVTRFAIIVGAASIN